jgi:endonuclease YncB( thermonuclease family)
MAAKRKTRKPTRKTTNKRGGLLLPAIAVATVAAIVGHDHWSTIRPVLSNLAGGDAAATVLAVTHPLVPSPLARPESPARAVASATVPPAPIPAVLPTPMAAPAQLSGSGTTSVSESFGLCGQGTHINCVYDGSTFWVRGTRIRIADIETPTPGAVHCAEEERRANAAKLRLLSLLNAGPFSLQPSASGEAQDSAQRRILRGGQSLGEILVGEGLARRRVDRATSWCA